MRKVRSERLEVRGERLLSVLAVVLLALSAWGQVSVSEGQPLSAFEKIRQNRNFSASNYCIYPDSTLPALTPAPEGKKPFYISHYGRHGSRYLSNRKAYDIPYRMLCRADSLALLTPTGKDVLRELRHIIDDSEGRWGDLTGLGKRQHRQIACRMVERFPEVFSDGAYVDARSTTVTRCVLSMGAAVQQLVALNPRLDVTMRASRKDMWYMNHQDTLLRNRMETPETRQAFNAFCQPLIGNYRLMQMLFTDVDAARKVLDGFVATIQPRNGEQWLNYYLILSGLIQQNTRMSERSQLVDLFTYEDFHCFWQCENAWWYANYGPSPLNGGDQPYSQRYLLRHMIHEADSCLRLPRPGASLRFGHETVMLPLTCLLGINGFDFQTADLAALEPNGWWACLVFPMASNIQLVFYRSSPDDKDIVIKVLLNEQEATLPVPTDIAPYYRWRDFREYYLKKLDDYETLRRTSSSASPLPADR